MRVSIAELRDIDLMLAVDDLRRLQSVWDESAKREKEADADIDLSRYRLAEKERELSKFQSLLEEKGLFVGDLSEQRRRMQSILERLDAGLLLLEEKGKNLIGRLSELRQKLHHSETRSATRTGELERLSQDRGETDARLRALYGQLNELRREAEAVRKARMAADDELARINAEIRRSRKLLEDDRAEVAKAEQALNAFRLEEELLGQRAEQLKEQRQAAQSTLSARRSRLEALAGQLARVRREIAAADSDVDKRVRVLDSRRRDLEGLRDGLTEARAEARGLEEVDRAFASASPALAWALAQERALPGLVGPVAEAIRAPQHYEVLVERLLGADLFGLLVADFESASGISSQIVAHTAGEMSLMPLLGSRTRLQGTPAAGSRLIDDLSYDDSVRAAVEALLGDVFVVESIDEALELSAADETGARFATVEGAVVWPTGKLTLGTQVGDTEGVLARKRRLNELNDDMGALTASVGAAESVLMDAEEALSAAQQDALELSQKVAGLTGEHDSLLEEIGRLEQQMRSLDTEAEGVEERISDIRLRTAKDRPTATALTDRIAACETELERLEESAVVSREQRDLRFREESAVSERLSTCQVEIATVSEREVHLKRQVNTITSELRELEDTVRSARESEIAFELLRQRIQPVHDLYVVLQERADHWAHKLKDRARFEQADSESLRETIQTAQAAVREVQAEIDEKSESATELRVEKGQLEVQVNQAVRRIVEDLGMPLETALEASRTRQPIGDRGPRASAAQADIESRSGQPDRHGGVRVAAQPPGVHGVADRRPRQQPPSTPEGGRRDRPQDAGPVHGDVRSGGPLVPGGIRTAVPRRDRPAPAHRPG